MELVIKHFSELSIDELYDLLKLRVEVFVVEQSCPYQELDSKDKNAYHLFLKDNNEIVAYLRVFFNEIYMNAHIKESDILFNVASIGRVVSSVRRKGYATTLLKEAVNVAKEKYSAERIVLEAQVYAKSLYENIGFVQTSAEFLEDGISHVQMMLNCR